MGRARRGLRARPLPPLLFIHARTPHHLCVVIISPAARASRLDERFRTPPHSRLRRCYSLLPTVPVLCPAAEPHPPPTPPPSTTYTPGSCCCRSRSPFPPPLYLHACPWAWTSSYTVVVVVVIHAVITCSPAHPCTSGELRTLCGGCAARACAVSPSPPASVLAQAPPARIHGVRSGPAERHLETPPTQSWCTAMPHTRVIDDVPRARVSTPIYSSQHLRSLTGQAPIGAPARAQAPRRRDNGAVEFFA